MLDYIISEVKPKSGIMRQVHRDVLHCECYIIDIEKGERAIIKVRLNDPYDETTTFRTSLVEDFYFSKDGMFFTIETANTVYTLSAMNRGAFPFSEELIRE